MTQLEKDAPPYDFDISPAEPRSSEPAADGRWLPDAPSAVVGMWILLIGLIGSDIALLKPMVAAATDEPSGWLTWLLTIGIGVALATAMYLAAEYRMRGKSGAATVFLLLWLAAVVLSFFFRLEFHSPSGAGVGGDPVELGTGATAPPSTYSTAELLLAALLTALLVLTGAIAAGLTALTHDELQKQRRSRARRVAWLRARHARALDAEKRHATAVSDRELELGDLRERTERQREKLPGVARSIKEEIRLRMATALGDPASTSELTRHRPGLTERSHR